MVEVKDLSAYKIVFLSIAEHRKGGGRGKLRRKVIPLLSIYPHLILPLQSPRIYYRSPTLS